MDATLVSELGIPIQHLSIPMDPKTKVMETYIEDSPVLLPPPPVEDKTLRPCINYRGLNKITVKNHYPQPLISSAFEPLQGATVFSKQDLRNAYNLVRIQDGDKWKTAFNMASCHYECLVMPFGLTNAPAVFQALVNDVLCEMLNRFVFIYLKDILVFSRFVQEHMSHIRQHSTLELKLHTCAFFFHFLNTTERNYNVGNLEPLAVKMALEE
nr:unnamed protein product [Salmo salar]|eukprot:XP_014027888.1 PREDICTED: RNA-directed DNA polymerase homolog [Salmo salar]